jgi:CDP-diacylglycerol---glycerol-3-phosphate 3-phosphatidyltransferase
MTSSFIIPNPADIEILHSPEEFYDRLLTLINCASERLLVASLYIGEGPQERAVVEALTNKAANIPVTLLLDKLRSTRTGCRPVSAYGDRIILSLYSSSLHRGLAKFLPERVNEGVSVQHIKAVVSDDMVLLTGANLNSSYFQHRQDRYLVVRNRALADFVADVISQPHSVKPPPVIDWASEKTVIHVGVQAGYEMINGVDHMLNSAVDHCIANDLPVVLASGYLNITEELEEKLAKLSDVVLLTACPEANSFHQSQGSSKHIPGMYSYFEEKLKMKHPNWTLLEYVVPGWTFHAKGLWVYDRHNRLPIATLLGSSNLSYRSRDRDLELCFLLQTRNRKLQQEISSEADRLMEYTRKPELSELQARSPVWLKTLTSSILRYFL